MHKLKNSLFCFSPAVMLGTFVIEIALAIYTVARYKMNEIGKLTVAMLVFLAIFQLAEYNVCEGGWIAPDWASRIGYIAITMLPPLGLHMAYALGGVKKRPLVPIAYIAGAAFIAFFLFGTQALSGHECMGNYVIFQMAPLASPLYGLYYYALMLAGVYLSWRFAQGKDRRVKNALYGFCVGYLAFLVPTTAANLVDPSTIAGIPSIMCGFAVLFALTLACWVLPNAGTKR